MDKIRLSGFIEESVVDGPGIRYVLFTQGCPHGCIGCHNPSTHDEKGGYLENIERLVSDIRENDEIDGITISGGEPFIQTKSLKELVIRVRRNRPDLNIMVYTGYTYDELRKMMEENPDIEIILNNIDILIDGRFEIENKTLDIPFIGSRNQKAIFLSEAGKKIMERNGL